MCWRFYYFSRANIYQSTTTIATWHQTPDLSSHEGWVCLVTQVYWTSFSVGFFRSFFKKNDPTKLYWLVQKRIETKRPGGRLWENTDIRIDRGETLADGSTNIVWQRQALTKVPALKKINTHTKIVTQRVSPNSDAQELQKDFFEKLGWVCHLKISCNSLLIEITQVEVVSVLCSLATHEFLCLSDKQSTSRVLDPLYTAVPRHHSAALLSAPNHSMPGRTLDILSTTLKSSSFVYVTEGRTLRVWLNHNNDGQQLRWKGKGTMRRRRTGMPAVPVYFILFSNLTLQSTSRRSLLNARGISFSSCINAQHSAMLP